jgi:hypothetical protein
MRPQEATRRDDRSTAVEYSNRPDDQRGTTVFLDLTRGVMPHFDQWLHQVRIEVVAREP